MIQFRLPEELAFLQNRNAPQTSTDAALTGRVSVITGATSGVGLEALPRLARGGAHIVTVARNPEKAMAAWAKVGLRRRSSWSASTGSTSLSTVPGCTRPGSRAPKRASRQYFA